MELSPFDDKSRRISHTSHTSRTSNISKSKNDAEKELDKLSYPPKSINGVPYNTEPVDKAAGVLKGLRETVNQLALVGSFIAAIQTALLALSFDQNSTGVQRATNALFFTSLLLDIIGTSIALVGGVMFQKHIIELEYMHASLSQMEEAVERIKELRRKWMKGGVKDDKDNKGEGKESDDEKGGKDEAGKGDAGLDKEEKDELEYLWHEEIRRTEEFNRIRPLIQLGGTTTSSSGNSTQNINPLSFSSPYRHSRHSFSTHKYHTRLTSLLLRISAFGQSPNPHISDAAFSAVSTIALGVLACLIGICLFLVSTQPPSVYISTFSIFGATCVRCGFPWVSIGINRVLRSAFGRGFVSKLGLGRWERNPILPLVFGSVEEMPFVNETAEWELKKLTSAPV